MPSGVSKAAPVVFEVVNTVLCTLVAMSSTERIQVVDVSSTGSDAPRASTGKWLVCCNHAECAGDECQERVDECQRIDRRMNVGLVVVGAGCARCWGRSSRLIVIISISVFSFKGTSIVRMHAVDGRWFEAVGCLLRTGIF